MERFNCITTVDIPGELSCENLISPHIKIMCYLHMWKDDHCYVYMTNCTFCNRNNSWFWYFIGVCSNKWNITGLLGDVKSLGMFKNISVLKEKFRISTRPCNILHILFAFMIFYTYISYDMLIVSELSKLWHFFFRYLCVFLISAYSSFPLTSQPRMLQQTFQRSCVIQWLPN